MLRHNEPVPPAPQVRHPVACRLLSAPAGGRDGAFAITLPAGPCAITPADDGGVRFVPPDSPAPGAALRLEPVLQPGHPLRLLAVAKAAGVLRINGLPAPRLTVLREHDQVQWGSSITFSLALVRHAVAGPPPPEWVGRPCPVCRVPFTADVRSYGCACGTRLHGESSEDGLQCAQRRGSCPTCHQPVALEVLGAAPPA